MNLFSAIFYFFALVTLGSASVVVFSKNIVRSAFALLFAFFGVAGLYALLLADFLAITQLLVYVGSILVLILFGVMLTSRAISVDMKTGTVQTAPALVLVGFLAATLIFVFWTTAWRTVGELEATGVTAPKIGTMLLTSYVLPFEIASVVLLVALIGAALIARREKKA